MINERIALLMLEGEIPKIKGIDPHYTRRFYNSVQTLAQASIEHCECGRLNKFQSHMKVATKLFSEGNETVKNGIVNVYLYSVCTMLDLQPERMNTIAPLLPKVLMDEFHHMHVSTGL